MEKWLPIKDYEGLYEVSSLGRVRALSYKIPKILKPRRRREGYYQINLTKNGKSKTFKLHRLVALTFIPTDDETLDVNHIDENKENNTVSNLEWLDRRSNINHGTGNARRSRAKKKGTIISMGSEGMTIYASKEQVAQRYDLETIEKCLSGEIPEAFGMTWFSLDK